MILQNLHAHSTFDDGRSTAEEMVRGAMRAGLTSIGLSIHAPMPFVSDWTIPEARLPEFFAEMERLKAAYEGKIRVYTGIEWDVLCETDIASYDYVIGSAHHLPLAPIPPAVDNSAEETERYLAAHFDGDADAAAEMYFAEVSRAAENPEVDIVGHFDLLTKFDERRHFFDENSPRYRLAALSAMEKLVAAGKIFEINTGAISRGYRQTPYPSKQLLCDLRAMGGKITISSDAHHADWVACAFGSAEELAKACGFTEIWQLENKKFVPVSI